MRQDEPAPKGVLHRQGHRVKLDQGERVGGKAILRDKGRLPVLVLPDLARERIGFHKFTRRPHCTDLAQPIGGGSDVHAGNAFRARSAKHEQPLVRTERGADERGGLRFGRLPNPIKARREFAHPIGRTLVGIQPGEKIADMGGETRRLRFPLPVLPETCAIGAGGNRTFRAGIFPAAPNVGIAVGHSRRPCIGNQVIGGQSRRLAPIGQRALVRPTPAGCGERGKGFAVFRQRVDHRRTP